MSDYWDKICKVSDKDAEALMKHVTGKDIRSSATKLQIGKLIVSAVRDLGLTDDATVVDMFTTISEQMNDTFRDYAAFALYLYSYSTGTMADLYTVDNVNGSSIVYVFDVADLYENGLCHMYKLFAAGFIAEDFPTVTFYSYLCHIFMLGSSKEHEDVRRFLESVMRMLNPEAGSIASILE